MADKLHGNITEADGIHEPKGISTANAGEVYAADGLGSGTWKSSSDFIDETYICVYLDPQLQSRTFTAGDVNTLTPFALTYTQDPEANNLTYNDTDKTLTYTGSNSIISRIQVTISIALVGVGSPTLDFYVQKSTDNGVTWITNTKSRASRKFSSNDVGVLSLSCLGRLDPNDKLRLAVQTDSDETFIAYNINFNVFGFTAV